MEKGVRMQIENVITIWPSIKNIFSVPHSEAEYEELVFLLDSLIDEIGEKEDHPLSSLAETVSALVEVYESNHVAELYSSPTDALQYLLEEHCLRPSDFPEIGSQEVLSDLLTGKTSLTIQQIKSLSARFKVSPLVFLQD